MKSECCNAETFRVKNKYSNLKYDVCKKCGKSWVVTIEEWVSLLGFENRYEISTTGKIRTITRLNKEGTRNRVLTSRILKSYKGDNGYLSVKLNYGYGTSTKYMKNLVAQNWIPNPHNYRYVEHISGNKDDNSYLNLKWIQNDTRKEDSRKIYGRD